MDEEDKRRKARELISEDFEIKLTHYSIKLRLLEELAWIAEMSKQHNLLISSVEVLKCLHQYYGINFKNYEQQEILFTLRTLGLLQSQYLEKEKCVSENYYYFPDVTFQEYFAAKYWVRKYCSEKGEERSDAEVIFKRFKYYPQYEIVWLFVSGILRQKSQQMLNLYLQLFQSEPLEIFGLMHVGVIIRFLEECETLKYNQIYEKMIEHVIRWITWSIKDGIRIRKSQEEQKIDILRLFGRGLGRQIQKNTFRSNVELNPLRSSLRRSYMVFSHPMMVDFFIKNLTATDKEIMLETLLFLRAVLPVEQKIIDIILANLDCSDLEIFEASVWVVFKLYSFHFPSKVIWNLVDRFIIFLKDDNPILCLKAIDVLEEISWIGIPIAQATNLLDSLLEKFQQRSADIR